MTAATSPPRGITLAPTSSTGISDQAARLRAEVALASVIVAPHWPIESFIAVNPLGGLEDVPFAAALARAGDVFGARGTLTETEFRDCHAAGRVTDADLDTVLLERVPQAVTRASLRFGATSVTMLELLRLDLLHGEPAPPPVRSVVTRAEERSVQLASAVDANVAKWCAGYFGAPGATWVMPGRAAGLYSAWRALAPHDRDFPTMARRSLRALPVQPDEAAITALGALGVSESDWREYCVAHLTRLPGWAGHVRWRASRAGVHDELFEFLTIRLVVDRKSVV